DVSFHRSSLLFQNQRTASHRQAGPKGVILTTFRIPFAIVPGGELSPGWQALSVSVSLPPGSGFAGVTGGAAILVVGPGAAGATDCWTGPRPLAGAGSPRSISS